MAKLPKHMDLQELMAHDLEFRQKQRYRQAKHKAEFLARSVEIAIEQQITFLRSVSETYNPNRGRYHTSE